MGRRLTPPSRYFQICYQTSRHVTCCKHPFSTSQDTQHAHVVEWRRCCGETEVALRSGRRAAGCTPGACFLSNFGVVLSTVNFPCRLYFI